MKYYIGKNGGRRFEARKKSLLIDYVNQRTALTLICYEIDENGNRVDGENVKDYRRVIVVDNTYAVDCYTGERLEPLDEPDSYQSIEIGGRLYSNVAIGAWDYFINVIQSTPVIIEYWEQQLIQKNRHMLMPEGLLAEEEEIETEN